MDGPASLPFRGFTMKPKHSPAPWTLDPTDFTNGVDLVRAADRTIIAEVPMREHALPETKANARAIAALPRLLAMSKRAVELCECGGPDRPCDICGQLFDAIEDAEPGYCDALRAQIGATA